MTQRLCFSTVLILILTSATLSQETWELKLDKDGIKVYTRSHPRSAFDEFKATSTVDLTMEEFMAIMKDIASYPDWVSNTEECSLLDRPSDSIQIYHNVVKVPFPFQNRDAVYLNAFQYDAQTKKLTITIENQTDYLEPQDDLVRMPFGEGKWEFVTKPDGNNEVTLQMVVDPGGSLPAWLVNKFITESPYETLKALQVMGKKMD
ncbi:MAG: hypothetical protein KQI35_18915 [Bacteroidetes bacterium]|nr:hypothetical protein [Bacteroidota bacterium]